MNRTVEETSFYCETPSQGAGPSWADAAGSQVTKSPKSRHASSGKRCNALTACLSGVCCGSRSAKVAPIKSEEQLYMEQDCVPAANAAAPQPKVALNEATPGEAKKGFFMTPQKSIQPRRDFDYKVCSDENGVVLSVEVEGQEIPQLHQWSALLPFYSPKKDSVRSSSSDSSSSVCSCNDPECLNGLTEPRQTQSMPAIYIGVNEGGEVTYRMPLETDL